MGADASTATGDGGETGWRPIPMLRLRKAIVVEGQGGCGFAKTSQLTTTSIHGRSLEILRKFEPMKSFASLHASSCRRVAASTLTRASDALPHLQSSPTHIGLLQNNINTSTKKSSMESLHCAAWISPPEHNTHGMKVYRTAACLVYYVWKCF